MLNIKKIWNDPVGSGVISSVIVIVLTSGYTAIKAYVDNVSFTEVMLNIMGVQVQLWIIALMVIGCIMVCVVFIKWKGISKFRYDKHSYNCDKEWYDSLLNDLKPSGSISFLRNNNFAGFSFNLSSLDELERFYQKYSNNPQIEFFHPEVEILRIKLMSDINHFKNLICLNTFPVGINDLQTVPPEWEENDPLRFRNVVHSIHEAADRICTDYDEFVKLGRKIIKL